MRRAIINIMLITVILFSVTGCGLLGGDSTKNTSTETTLDNTENTSQVAETEADETENTGEQTAKGKTMEANLYFASEDNSAVKKEIREIQVVDAAILRAHIQALLEGPKTEGLRQTIPEGTAIRGVNLKNKVAIIDFTKEYLEAEGLSEVTERVSIVKTLTEIPGIEVEKVRIMVEGKDLIGPSGKPLGDMLPADLDVNGTPLSGEMKTLALYFGNSDADKVVAEKREVIVIKGDTIEKAIILEMMEGPDSKDLHPVIPEGTKLISVKTKDGLCTVNLSKEFVDNHPGGSAGESMTLYSIINSLTELSTIKKVQFLIDGEKREVYTHAVFDKPFSRNTDIIGESK